MSSLDFGSGQDPSIMRSSPASGSVLSMEPHLDSLSPSPLPAAPPPLVGKLSLSLKNTYRKKERRKERKKESKQASKRRSTNPQGKSVTQESYAQNLSLYLKPVTDILKILLTGVPGWLSQLSIQLQLRSWSHGSWVQAPRQALCWQLRAWSLL